MASFNECIFQYILSLIRGIHQVIPSLLNVTNNFRNHFISFIVDDIHDRITLLCKLSDFDLALDQLTVGGTLLSQLICDALR